MKIKYKALPSKNLLLSTKPYYIDKDRKSGESDLERLAETERFEGSWIYSQQQERWYNFSEKLYEAKVIIPHAKISGFGTKLSHYHTHPTKGKTRKERVERKIKELLTKLKDNSDNTAIQNVQKARTLAKEHYRIGPAFPSGADIKLYMNFIKKNPECDLDFKVVSPAGISTTKINENLDIEELDIDYICQEYFNILLDSLNQIKETSLLPNAGIYSVMENINRQMEEIFQISMQHRTS